MFSEIRLARLMSAATSRRIIVDAVCKDVGLFSVSERSGLGYTGVSAEFRLSQ